MLKHFLARVSKRFSKNVLKNYDLFINNELSGHPQERYAFCIGDFVSEFVFHLETSLGTVE